MDTDTTFAARAFHAALPYLLTFATVLAARLVGDAIVEAVRQLH